MGINSSDSTACFGGALPDDFTPSGAPRFSVLPVPYDLTASYISGTRNGPRAIIEASTHMELYDEELRAEPWKAGMETLPPLEPTTAGPEKMIEKVEQASAGILESGAVPVLLGGEHSVTLGLARALKRRYPALSVLQLDAHADMREDYQGSPFNHACVARRIVDICPVVQVGIRSMSAEEAAFLESRADVRTFYASDVRECMPTAEVLGALTDDVFITIDLDVFDPSIMPSTGTPEPGGLGWYEVCALMRAVAGAKRVIGFDVVELCPIAGNVAPDFLAARLVYKIMGYINASKDVL